MGFKTVSKEMMMKLFHSAYTNFSIEGWSNFIRNIPSFTVENKNRLLGLILLIAGAIFARCFYVLNRSVSLLEKKIQQLETKKNEIASDESVSALVKRIEFLEANQNGGLPNLNMVEVLEQINSLEKDVCKLMKATDSLRLQQGIEIPCDSVEVTEEDLDKRKKIRSIRLENHTEHHNTNMPLKLKNFDSVELKSLPKVSPSPRSPRPPIPSEWLNPQKGKKLQNDQPQTSEDESPLVIQIIPDKLINQLGEYENENSEDD